VLQLSLVTGHDCRVGAGVTEHSWTAQSCHLPPTGTHQQQQQQNISSSIILSNISSTIGMM